MDTAAPREEFLPAERRSSENKAICLRLIVEVRINNRIRGWLERFSNEPRSNATSAGAYRSGSSYQGAHGHSMQLEGLDPTNSNALSRAIVVHGAWYVSEAMIGFSGMLGRSQGCFAVAESSLPEIMKLLRPGRLIYADKA